MIRKIIFYKTAQGKSPIVEFLDSLSDKQVEKILVVLTNAFIKKKKKIPKKEISLAQKRMKDYFKRKK